MANINREELMIGCYHEIGHIIADLFYFPQHPKVEGVIFSKRRRLESKRELKWVFPQEKEACAMTLIAGGVFQQMKTLDISQDNYNAHEKLLNFFSKRIALIRYLQRVVLPEINGMEVDLEYLELFYYEAIRLKRINKPLDLVKVKNEAILMLLPYLANPQVDALSNLIADRIINNNCLETFISIDEIKPYLIIAVR